MGLNLTILLGRNDVRIVLICTVTGGILQVISKQYLKIHPEFLNDGAEIKRKSRPLPLRFPAPRGGALFEISGISIKIVTKVVVNFLAKNGLIAGLVTGGTVAISKIPPTAISAYLRESVPTNLLDRKKFILVDGEKIYLDQCDQNIKYLFDILENDKIPFDERKKIAHSVLTFYLNRAILYCC